MTYGILDKPPLDDLYSKSFNEEEKEAIEHGWLKDQAAKVHKYIKRWKSKSGKWVYQYEKKVKEKTNSLVSEFKARRIKGKNKALYTNDPRFKKPKYKPKYMPSNLLKNKEEKKYKYVGRVKTPYGYRYFYNKLEYDRYMARYKNIIAQDDNPISIKNLKTLAKPETIRESMKNVNPNYDNGENIPYAINCQRCAMSFEMRQRGFDVEAGGNFSLSTGRHSFATEEEIYNYLDTKDPNFGVRKISGEERKTNNNYVNPEKEWFNKQMNIMPPDSRGFLIVNWVIDDVSYGGHIVNWSKDSKGTVSIVDSQTGDIYTPEKFYQYPAGYSQVIRTDNVPINPDFTYLYAMDDTKDDIFITRRA